ncbi:MAG TPA: undecaprenyl-diphosphatase UppP [Caldithrix abyssi]|uniref:Undecaprenyl-diphosphatase n=1 Tax=Caldithrix abyssi TaxID=187145 RepID=A0A7V4WV56_CALAY|nr:undecaprenyl-diphosphatase UppP [Caldithrix abyssi]
MVELLKALLLGLIQGLTEFLPVSSSGHLVIFAEILNFKEQGIAFEVFVHFGTLLSVLVAFRYELKRMLSAPYVIWIKKDHSDAELQKYLNWDLYIIVATIPAVIVGLFFKDVVESFFDSILLVFFMLFITAFLMWGTQFLRQKDVDFSYGRSFLIGVAQAFAIMPGISRSGSTIFTGMALGLNREDVARFSFLMSIPAILGAVVLKLNDLLAAPPSSGEMLNMLVGTLMAAVSGYLAIIWLLDVVKKGKLQWFGYYCFAVALSGLIWYYAG